MPTLLQRRAIARLFKKGQEPDLATAEGRIAFRRARQAEEAAAWATWTSARAKAAARRAAIARAQGLAGSKK